MALVALVAVVFHGEAVSLIRIVITPSSSDALKIAVVPFAQVDTALPTGVDFSEVVRRDLSFSGRFSSIAPDDMLEQPSEGSLIKFNNWQTQEIPYLVIGRVVADAEETLAPGAARPGPPAYSVEFQVFDVRNEQQMAGFSVELDQDNWRNTAHAVSRYIYETILNEESFFGQKLIYVKKRYSAIGRETYSLVLADLDGEEVSVFHESPWPIYSPSVTLNGHMLAYVTFINQSAGIFMFDLRTQESEQLLPKFGPISAPSWSPDGRSLAFTRHERGNSEIYIYALDTRALKRVTYHSAIDTEPAWSTDGDHLYFTSDRAGGVQVYQKAVNYHSRATRLTYASTYNASVAVAPNGREIAFVHRKHNRDRIMVLDLETGLESIVSEGDYDESPAYSNNSRMVMFTSSQYDRKTISFVDVQSRSQYQFKAGNHSILDSTWARDDSR